MNIISLFPSRLSEIDRLEKLSRKYSQCIMRVLDTYVKRGNIVVFVSKDDTDRVISYVKRHGDKTITLSYLGTMFVVSLDILSQLLDEVENKILNGECRRSW